MISSLKKREFHAFEGIENENKNKQIVSAYFVQF